MAIRLLLPDVSSLIAAGEVVERPSSVAKELVENSLDAQATEITVEIRGGGVEYIRVIDNGTGIPADEVELAFQRFATSKVSEAHDLESIATLGFRGEALPSISAVANVSMVTRTADQDFGTRLDVVDGKTVRNEPSAASPGTSITVRQLFRNFPARRKFLRTPATETSRVQTLVTRYALAYPEVRFQLRMERSSPFSSPGSGDLREAISAVYGLEIAEAMMELPAVLGDEEHDDPFIWGMVSPASLDRANRSYISLFVNRRWVQNRSLSYAVEQSYHGFMAERRYPLAVINVAIPHEQVDVNVHPAKTEVRFRHENKIFGAVQQAVRHTLTTSTPVPEIRHASTTHPGAPSRPSAAPFWPIEPFVKTDLSSSESHRSVQSDSELQSTGSESPAIPAAPLPPKKALPVLRVLGQVQNTYVVAEGPDGMYLIDQHAAHERVTFERVRADAIARTPRVQSLMEPATVELNPQQQELVESQQAVISPLGFVVEPFGGSLYLIRGVPSLVSEGDPSKGFLDILDLMTEGGGFESWEERAAYSIACHSSIRAGKTLSHEEMTELTRQLENCQQPNTCPHGRPTMIHLSSSHLEREFGRR